MSGFDNKYRDDLAIEIFKLVMEFSRDKTTNRSFVRMAELISAFSRIAAVFLCHSAHCSSRSAIRETADKFAKMLAKDIAAAKDNPPVHPVMVHTYGEWDGMS